ncbi:hypothetical protein K504DRAFT_448631 [Pleomassaria siparia CBS 279.74]|uniref:F-box domain-containing protein n=1 Tax=Pleomassaria siparia CBS 279.74 TaxID=1314801 RepID=A0A6G1JY87_9PLEO|nr:hypothetical protein K504DRAFT_448631 [Pleomassaria siparia CBS 279.74]
MSTDPDLDNILMDSHANRSSIRSRNLQQLPGETLLSIASQLDDRNDLASLAKVSKKLCAIAQDELYKLVYLSEDKPDTICGLLKTLEKKPELAEKVSHLIAYPLDCLVSCDFTGCPRTAILVQRHGLTLGEQIRAPRLVGCLLDLLPKLKILRILVFTKKKEGNVRFEDYVDDALPCLFRPEFLTSNNLASIKGLAALQELYVQSGTLNWSWCTLPQIKSITVGLCINFDIPATDLMSNATSLDITMESCYFNHEHGCLDNLEPFLCRFPMLEQFIIRVHHSEHDRFEPLEDIFSGDDWTSVITLLAPLAPSLQNLALFPKQSFDDLGGLFPIRGLSDFHKLKSLSIPMDVLLGSDFSTQNALDTAGHIQPLPPHLHGIWIQTPKTSIVVWLEHVLEMQAARYPELRIVELLCYENVGADYETIEEALYKPSELSTEISTELSTETPTEIPVPVSVGEPSTETLSNTTPHPTSIFRRLQLAGIEVLLA